MDNPETKKKGGAGVPGPVGSRAPAKGESSGGDFPRGDSATISDDNSLSTPSGMEASEQDLTFVDPAPSPDAGRPRQSAVPAGRRQLRPGDVFGGRYEIVQMLGEGGMGAVFLAAKNPLFRTQRPALGAGRRTFLPAGYSVPA